MFISMCLADGSMAEHPQGTESQKVKGLTGKKTGGKKKNVYGHYRSLHVKNDDNDFPKYGHGRLS